MTHTYFAYGSNLLFARLHARCPSIVNIGVGRLGGHRLTFTKPGGDNSGKCGIESADDDHVIGVLYRMTSEEKSILDEIEGVGHAYIDREIQVLCNKAVVDCFTYYPTRLDSALPPWDWYKAFVLEGARENAFPPSYLSMIEAVDALEDPDQQRRHSNLAILQQLVSRQVGKSPVV